jgi:hypothetical protein
MPDTDINNYSTPTGGTLPVEPLISSDDAPPITFETGYSSQSVLSPSDEKEIGELIAEDTPVLPPPTTHIDTNEFAASNAVSGVTKESIIYMMAKAMHEAAEAILNNMAKTVEETKKRMRERLTSVSYIEEQIAKSPVTQKLDEKVKGLSPDDQLMNILKSPLYGAWLNQLPPSEKAELSKVGEDYAQVVAVGGKMEALAGAGLTALLIPAADIVVGMSVTGDPITNAQVPNLLEPSSAAFQEATKLVAVAIPPDVSAAMVAFAGLFLAPAYNITLDQTMRDSAAKGAAPKEINKDFAEKYAKNILGMVKASETDPALKLKMDKIFGEDGSAIFKTVMLSMAIALKYRVETGATATREEFQSLLKGEMTRIPKDDVRYELLKEMNKQLEKLPDSTQESLRKAIVDYLAKGPKLESMLEPLQLLVSSQELKYRGDIPSR